MILVYSILVVTGLAFGSFINALVWRLHEQELQTKQRPSKQREKYINELSIIKGRSMCPHCRHPLFTKDLVPVVSWLWLRGRCRYCRHRIEDTPVSEIATVILFIVSYVYWPSGFHRAGLLEFVIWLLLLVGFVALTIYDIRWYLLPNRIVYPLIGLVTLQILTVILLFNGRSQLLLSSLAGVLIGGGIFYGIYQLSNGKWIGGGDVKLGALLGFIVGGPLMSCLLLFTASASGTLVSLPLIALGKAKRNTLLPFGPFLLFSVIIVRLFGASILHWLQHHAGFPS